MERDRSAVDPIVQAAQWRGQAGVLRRRAARGSATDEERAEALRRADWYDARAEIVDRCYPEPPIFPPELRTPVDALDLVDDLRRAVEKLRAIAHATSWSEIEDFRRSLRRSAGEGCDPGLLAEADFRTQATLASLLEHAEKLGPLLGVFRGVFTSYDVEIVEAKEAAPE